MDGLRGSGDLIGFWPKLNLEFTTFVYDPIDGVVPTKTLSASANSRLEAHHTFSVSLTDSLLGRCGWKLHGSTKVSQ